MLTDVAVIVTTCCRPSLVRAIESIFHQDHKKLIHILIGVDKELFGNFSEIYQDFEKRRPDNILLTVINPGYSTSSRHNGIHSCIFGGSLKTALTFLASSRYVTYLDDDDWYESSHLRLLRSAIEGNSWAFSLCNYADSDRGVILGPDEIESVGPGQGIYNDNFGGFVRPSALMMDKLRLASIMHLWSESAFPNREGEDRLIFNALLPFNDFGQTGIPTVNYSLDPNDPLHPTRLNFLISKGINIQPVIKTDSVR